MRLTLLSLLMFAASAASAEGRDLFSDTWVATDALGRELPSAEQTGPPRENKTIGMFYFLWTGGYGDQPAYDNTKLLAENPEDPEYGPVHATHFWGEPEMGYYKAEDEYVIRKHVEMLMDAGVDMIAFDVTNALTYEPQYLKICEVYRGIREKGGRTPDIAFMANSHHVKTVRKVYDDFYAKNLYPELWYRWQGRPLILTPMDGHDEEVRGFFTMRHSWAWNAAPWFGDGRHKWMWLDHYPQSYGWDSDPNVPEATCVSVAQHPVSNIGRSFHDGRQPEVNEYGLTGKEELGLFFAEQWRRAHEINPPFIFVTGWNEWIAQRFLSDGNQTFLGRVLPAGGTFFVDAYNQEFNRDIEPMKGGHTDNYFYQLVANVRKYKGARPIPVSGPPKTITIDGAFEDWVDVQPEFRDHVGDTFHRDAPGWGKVRHTNKTGRNDITDCKVAYDTENVYFLSRTADELRSEVAENFMVLFVDVDQDKATGWEGYDVMISNEWVQRSRKGWDWDVAGTAESRVKGNAMELAVSRKLVGEDDMNFDFHWADNIPMKGDIIEFSTHGDSAPSRRFDYRFVVEK